MASMLKQQPTLASQLVPSIPKSTNTKFVMTRTNYYNMPCMEILLPNSRTSSRFVMMCTSSKLGSFSVTKSTERSTGFFMNDEDIIEEEEEEEEDEEEVNEVASDYGTVAQIKDDLYQAVKGINRGIFGVASAKKYEIEGLVEMLESHNPNPDPMLDLMKVDGCWKLVYTTLTILGKKRSKLGLRNLISLGEFFQVIDVAKGKTMYVVKFNIRGMNKLHGQLTVESSFRIASNSRVEIDYDNSRITPDQLMNVLRKKQDLLLSIFNPGCWLEITYVDDKMMIGRDDKGNLYVLDR